MYLPYISTSLDSSDVGDIHAFPMSFCTYHRTWKTLFYFILFWAFHSLVCNICLGWQLANGQQAFWLFWGMCWGQTNTPNNLSLFVYYDTGWNMPWYYPVTSRSLSKVRCKWEYLFISSTIGSMMWLWNTRPNTLELCINLLQCG